MPTCEHKSRTFNVDCGPTNRTVMSLARCCHNGLSVKCGFCSFKSILQYGCKRSVQVGVGVKLVLAADRTPKTPFADDCSGAQSPGATLLIDGCALCVAHRHPHVEAQFTVHQEKPRLSKYRERTNYASRNIQQMSELPRASPTSC